MLHGTIERCFDAFEGYDIADLFLPTASRINQDFLPV